MKKEHQQNEMEYINVVSLMAIGILAMVRGLFLMIASAEEKKASPIYQTMDELVNLTFWGIPFFIGGICLIIAAVCLPYRIVNKFYSGSLIIGGFICALFFFIVALAGMNQSINWLQPVTFLIMSMCSGSYAYVGVLFYRK